MVGRLRGRLREGAAEGGSDAGMSMRNVDADDSPATRRVTLFKICCAEFSRRQKGTF